LLATLPAIGLVAYLLITQSPQIMMTFWDAVRTQVTLFGDAERAGDYVIMVTLAVQIVVLALPAIGMLFMFATLIWQPIKASLKQPTATRRAAILLALAAALAGIGFLWAPQLSFSSTRPGPDGVAVYSVPSRQHVRGRVSYPQTPPVGGNHWPVWQNCGFYNRPIADENGVHSLEHGAVWITYRPDLPRRGVSALRAIADRQTYILVSPYPGLKNPVVVSAWGRQLRLNSVRDSRLEQFIKVFRLAESAPERGGPCTGGTGNPR
jgi:hypothetical protein